MVYLLLPTGAGSDLDGMYRLGILKDREFGPATTWWKSRGFPILIAGEKPQDLVCAEAQMGVKQERAELVRVLLDLFARFLEPAADFNFSDGLADFRNF